MAWLWRGVCVSVWRRHALLRSFVLDMLRRARDRAQSGGPTRARPRVRRRARGSPARAARLFSRGIQYSGGDDFRFDFVREMLFASSLWCLCYFCFSACLIKR